MIPLQIVSGERHRFSFRQSIDGASQNVSRGITGSRKQKLGHICLQDAFLQDAFLLWINYALATTTKHMQNSVVLLPMAI